MRRRSNPDSEPNIRRIDTRARANKQTHGFQVHFLRGKNAVTRMFSDSLYGGKEGARRASLSRLLAPDLPALNKAGGKVSRARFDPLVDNLWRKESTCLDFGRAGC